MDWVMLLHDDFSSSSNINIRESRIPYPVVSIMHQSMVAACAFTKQVRPYSAGLTGTCCTAKSEFVPKPCRPQPEAVQVLSLG